MPPAVKWVEIEERSGKRREHVYVDSIEGLVSLVQMGALEIHAWGCRIDRPERPDRLVFDLDPDPAVGWEEVVRAAIELRARLDASGLESFVKTTGGKGLHVVVPIARTVHWDVAHELTRAIARAMVSDDPDRFIATMSKQRRKGKIFVDHFRNSRGATAVVAYSTRAREGAPISTPITWEELAGLDSPTAFDAKNIRQRIEALAKDPWERIGSLKQSLSRSVLKNASKTTSAPRRGPSR